LDLGGKKKREEEITERSQEILSYSSLKARQKKKTQAQACEVKLILTSVSVSA